VGTSESVDNTFMKGGVIPYITKQYIHEGWCGYLDRIAIPYITKQYIHAWWCGDLWKCGPREVVTKGSGDEGVFNFCNVWLFMCALVESQVANRIVMAA